MPATLSARTLCNKSLPERVGPSSCVAKTTPKWPEMPTGPSSSHILWTVCRASSVSSPCSSCHSTWLCCVDMTLTVPETWPSLWQWNNYSSQRTGKERGRLIDLQCNCKIERSVCFCVYACVFVSVCVSVYVCVWAQMRVWVRERLWQMEEGGIRYNDFFFYKKRNVKSDQYTAEEVLVPSRPCGTIYENTLHTSKATCCAFFLLWLEPKIHTTGLIEKHWYGILKCLQLCNMGTKCTLWMCTIMNEVIHSLHFMNFLCPLGASNLSIALWEM